MASLCDPTPKAVGDHEAPLGMEAERGHGTPHSEDMGHPTVSIRVTLPWPHPQQQGAACRQQESPEPPQNTSPRGLQCGFPH